MALPAVALPAVARAMVLMIFGSAGALLAANNYEDLQQMRQLLCRCSDGCRPVYSLPLNC